MIRNHDNMVAEAIRVLSANRTAYVPAETRALCTTIIQMDEDMDYLRHEISRYLPLVVTFRQFRSDVITLQEFIEYLRSDAAGQLLHFDDYKWEREQREANEKKWRRILYGNGDQ